MNILLVTNMYPSKEKAYAGIFVKNQYEELKRIFDKDDAIEIFYMKRQFTSKLGSLIKYLKAFLGFIPYLFKKYDVVHLHFFYPLIYLVWMYKKLHPKTKVVVTFHGSDINEKINSKNERHFKKVSKCIDFAIPVGKELADNVTIKLGLKTGRTLSAGVDNRVFYQEPLKDKIYDYIFVGSFLKIKGVDLLLESISKLPKDFSFCIVGKGEYYEAEIKRMINEGFNITLKIDQSQNELRSLFNQSRFLVQPSREEGFGLVVAEAMFCGLPVIVSNVGGFKEQVVNGKNGYLFKKEDVIQIKEYLLTLKNVDKSKYIELCENALNDSKELSLQNVCRELYGIYKKLNQSA
ncbi:MULTISPECIES: glycosyltransferase family 4 protein [Flavobacteriaceae]|uniref:glycosyltransferase family 4 protein n=1 Tax=Flavobacteriaceae TaxID=49546 RepID=UPI003A907BA1